MIRPKFTLASLLGMIAVVCAGLSIYQVVSQPPLPAMPPEELMHCLGCDPGMIFDPLERVYIAGPADHDNIVLSPNY